jgi:hypothetical protein
LQELRRAQPNILLCWIAPDGVWDEVLLTTTAQDLRQLVNSPSQTWRAPCLWCPLASFDRWQGWSPAKTIPDVEQPTQRPVLEVTRGHSHYASLSRYDALS